MFCGFGPPRTYLRDHGWDERTSSAKRRASCPGDNRGLRRCSRNWTASAPVTLQSAVRETGAARSSGAAAWVARKAGFRWPRPACPVKLRNRADPSRNGSQRSRIHRHLPALFFCESGPQKSVGAGSRWLGTPRFRLARNPSRISRIRANFHNRRQRIPRSGDERLSLRNRGYRQSAIAEPVCSFESRRDRKCSITRQHYAVERRHSLRPSSCRPARSNDTFRPCRRRPRRAICRRSRLSPLARRRSGLARFECRAKPPPRLVASDFF